MTARDLALILLQAPVDLVVEIDSQPIHSIAMFAGVLTIDTAVIALGDAEIVFFDAATEGTP